MSGQALGLRMPSTGTPHSFEGARQVPNWSPPSALVSDLLSFAFAGKGLNRVPEAFHLNRAEQQVFEGALRRSVRIIA